MTIRHLQSITITSVAIITLSLRTLAATEATDPAAIHTAKDFRVELIYSVPREQGSWVALTVDPKGRIIAGDQYGGIYRIAPAVGGAGATAKVEKLDVGIGGAHGLLYAFNSLYVMVNEGSDKHGLWRVRDLDGNGKFDKPEQLLSLQGGGEHGPHSLVLTPDGKAIMFNAGNHTKLPDRLDFTRAARAWQEDLLLPRMPDAGGHATGVMAPGGWIARTDPDAKHVELWCAGFRNEFDMAFDANGELFTFDADMEWDMGLPWYRPTRINHCTSGSESGWRNGSGKWPPYYADSLPAALDIGPGSPTGVTFGTGAKFPATYQRALFANDWTYGTMYAIHFVPDGASFRAEKEEFVTGRPLPLTDVVINRTDGALYFAIGGRKTQSALYRVSYIGHDSTAPVRPLPPTAEAKLRREIERLHDEGTGPEAIAKAWPHLANKDRFIRFAARVAIERQPSDKWADRALAEKNPQAAIESLIALCRVGDKALQPRIIEALGRVDFSSLDTAQRIAWLRAWELCFTRMGKPAPEVCARIAEKLDALYPQPDNFATRELCQLLVFLDSPKVVAQTLALMATAKDDVQTIGEDSLLARNMGYGGQAVNVHTSRPNRQQVAMLFALHDATAGWTPELRRAYFSWYPRALTWNGGNSFHGYIQNMRKEALAKFVPESERATLEALSSKPAPAIANSVKPKGPGKEYTVEDVVALGQGGLTGRNFAQGQAMFRSLACAKCHRFAGEGGSIGPDLTGAGNRYSLHDLAENIIDPSKVISDQYESSQLEMKNGDALIGRIISQQDGVVQVMLNPFAPDDLTPVNLADIKTRKPYPVSMMPPGLINGLNKDELLDLVAYIMSGGNANDKAFKK